MRYTPRPLDTSQIELPPGVETIVEELARHTHDVWARGRIAEGWTWGPHRDDATRQTPDLVPFEELSEQEKEYDRRTALESLKAILSLGYVLERGAPPAAATMPDGRTAEVPPAPLGDDLQDVVAVLERWRARDRAVWERRPDLFRALAAYLRRAGEPLVAHDVATEGLALWPDDLRLRQLRALVLADLGCPEDARAVLEPLRDAPHPDGASLEETLGILGRVYKDLARATRRPSARRPWLRKAFDEYAAAHQRTGGYWTGINAASLAVVLGRRQEAERLASAVRAQCLATLERTAASDPERYWLHATLGEAALIARRPEEARDRYRDAIAAAPRAHSWIASSRRNARLLADCLRLDWTPLAETLAPPRIVVFAGHMVDRPGRRPPRFPPAIENAVRDAIGAKLDAIGPAVCYSSAASGADILFLEEALARRNEALVVLPCPPAAFRPESVDLVPGADWGTRFEALLPRVHLFPPITSGRLDAAGIYHRFAYHVLLGLARHRGEELGTAPHGLALWDGAPGDGPDGTKGAIDLWQRLGVPWEHIDLTAIRDRTGEGGTRSHPPARRPARRRRPVPIIRALLFADVKDFSKMPEETVGPFVRHVLGLVSVLARKRSLAPIGRESRGDGFYLVFPSVAAAGCFALALADRVRRTDWARYGLPASLVMRIALHAGPVLRTRDPVSGRTVYVGTHVNRVARIEPITPPGQVYASQEFAALAALDAAPDFACDYVGQVPLAKGFGTFPMYHLRHRS